MTAITFPIKARRELSKRATFGLLASSLVALLASSSAPTPLYESYQQRWGFSDVTITVIFGVYAVAVLISLLIFGSLSDHVGRRPVLGAALAAQALVMVLFAFAGNLDALLLARVLQGLATGAALGAISAGLVDLHAAHGAVANAASAMAGTASGALGSAVFVQLLPAPTKLIYLALGVVFLVQAIGILNAPESSPRRHGALLALRPTLAIPPRARGALLIAAPSLVAVWALAGFYGSLGPSLAALITGSSSVILGGLTVFIVAGSASLTILTFHRLEARRFALVGNILVVVGVAIVLWSLSLGSAPVFFVGTALAGAGFGGGFQGGLRTIVPLAEPGERAGLLSIAYLISYLAMGLPAIGAGILATHSGLAATAREFGGAVIALSATTALGLALSARRNAQRVETVPALSPCLSTGQAA